MNNVNDVFLNQSFNYAILKREQQKNPSLFGYHIKSVKIVLKRMTNRHKDWKMIDFNTQTCSTLNLGHVLHHYVSPILSFSVLIE